MPILPLSEAPVVLSASYSPTGYLKVDRARREFWQFHFYLYDGRIRDGLDWVSFPAGSVCLTPPSVTYEAERPERSPHYYVHFTTSGRNGPTVPRIWQSGLGSEIITSELSALVREVHTHPARSRSRWWEFLWRLCETPAVSEREDLPRGLEAALHHLERVLHTPKPVAFLAERMGISQGHLVRLFHKHLGTTPVAWRRKRLAERARLLLSESHLSPSQIAESLGFRDLQRFNKTLRREFGMSPRALRMQGRDRKTDHQSPDSTT